MNQVKFDELKFWFDKMFWSDQLLIFKLLNPNVVISLLLLRDTSYLGLTHVPERLCLRPRVSVIGGVVVLFADFRVLPSWLPAAHRLKLLEQFGVQQRRRQEVVIKPKRERERSDQDYEKRTGTNDNPDESSALLRPLLLTSLGARRLWWCHRRRYMSQGIPSGSDYFISKTGL